MEAPKAPTPPINPYDGKSGFLFDSSEEHDEYKEDYPRRMQEYKEAMEKYKKDLAKYYEYKANEKAEEKYILDMLGDITITKTPNVSTGEEELSDIFNNVSINEPPKIIPTHGVWHRAHLDILTVIKEKKDYNHLTPKAKKLLNDVIDKRNSNDNIMLHDGNQLWSFYVSKTVEHTNEDMRGYLRNPLIREAVKKARTKHGRTKKGGSKRNKIRRNRTLRGGKDRGSPTTRPTYRASISREHFNELVRRNIERLARLERARLERERLERARLERERLAQEQQRRNNIFGYQHLPTGQTALGALMDAQTERDREREREREN